MPFIWKSMMSNSKLTYNYKCIGNIFSRIADIFTNIYFMKKYFLPFMLFISNQVIFAQAEKLIYGRIICDNKTISEIQITNLVNEKSAVSDINGNFSILSKAEDMLVFTSNNYDYKRKFLEQADFDSNNLVIVLTKKAEQLDEVVVSKVKSNPFDEGIYDKNIKTYTPAERRLQEAKSGMIAPLINLISGRTESLKKQLQVERNEKNLSKISYLYEDDYYIKKLKINPNLIKAFQYFIVDDKKLVSHLKSKNKSLIKFRMVELAQEFNKLQKS